MLQTEIDETLHNFAIDGSYCVVESLKETEFERTEKVYSPTKDQYFIRKYTRLDDRDWDSRLSLYRLLIESDATQIAKVFEAYKLADELVVIMEYIEGPSLYEYVGKSHPLPNEIINALMGDVLSAVNSLHNQDGSIVVHRDITPSNIVVYQDENNQTRAKLIDFGISRVFREGKDKDTRHLGTIGFAAPEQYGFGQTSVRSDIYALGAVLFFCLTGKNPTNNLLDTLPAEKNLPEQLRALIAKAMSIDSSKRHASVDEFRLDFISSLSSHYLKDLTQKNLIQKPQWSGLQKNSFMRIGWNIFVSLAFIGVIQVALFDPLIVGIKNAAQAKDYLLSVILVFFLIVPLFLLLLDFFGFYKRFKALAKFSLVSVIFTVVTVSFTISVLLFGLLGT